MREIHRTKRALLTDLLIIICVLGTLGIALKYTTFFDQWVYFPWFPNILDSAFLIFSVVVLAIMAKKKR